MKNEGDLIFEAYTKGLAEWSNPGSDPRSLLLKYYLVVQKASYARGNQDREGLNQALAEQGSIESEIEKFLGTDAQKGNPYHRKAHSSLSI